MQNSEIVAVENKTRTKHNTHRVRTTVGAITSKMHSV